MLANELLDSQANEACSTKNETKKRVRKSRAQYRIKPIKGLGFGGYLGSKRIAEFDNLDNRAEEKATLWLEERNAVKAVKQATESEETKPSHSDACIESAVRGVCSHDTITPDTARENLLDAHVSAGESGHVIDTDAGLFDDAAIDAQDLDGPLSGIGKFVREQLTKGTSNELSERVEDTQVSEHDCQATERLAANRFVLFVAKGARWSDRQRITLCHVHIAGQLSHGHQVSIIKPSIQDCVLCQFDKSAKRIVTPNNSGKLKEGLL